MTYLVHAATPQPYPSQSALDPSQVTPGIGGAVVFTFLAVALVLLLVSMNRHLKRVQFDEGSDRE